MRVMLALFLLATLTIVLLALRNRLFVKLALRNLPQRRSQTILIIVGLMLSTVITTTAFETGDTNQLYRALAERQLSWQR